MTAQVPQRLKILLSAYACEPNKGSEPDVGWNWALQLARFHDVTVLTRTNNRKSIEAELLKLKKTVPLPRFIYHDLGTATLKLKQLFTANRVYYVLWQRSAQEVVARAHQDTNFDLIHHVTFASYRYRTAIWGHGAASVWGPVGGAESIPLKLLPWRHPAALLQELFRNLNNLLYLATLQVTRKRAQDSSVVLANTREMQNAFAEMGVGAELVTSIGLHTTNVPERKVETPTGPLKLLYVGSLLSLKGVDMAIEALKLSGTNARYTLIGDGPFEVVLRRLVAKLGMEDRVEFLGRIPMSEVMASYRHYDILLFPSLHDTGGFAVIEAMLQQLPTICLKVGGPELAVQPGTGICVPLGSRRNVIRGLADAIQTYDRQRKSIVEHGSAARAVVISHYDWNQKGEQMAALYDQLLPEKRPRPLKVLHSSYACEPDKGSEPAVGWSWALQMSRFHDVWVMTRANNCTAIEKFKLTPEQKAHLHWVYVDIPRWGRFWKKGQRGIQLYYWLWQIAVWWRARKIHAEVNFDIVHHVNFGKYWIPSYLPFLPVKSVLGPLGGGESTPPGLEKTVSARGRRYELARNLGRSFVSALLGTSFALRRADIVFATTEQTRVRIKALGVERVVTEPQFAMHGEELDFFGKFPLRTEKPFRFISIGRLLHWKGFHLGLLAFARLHKKHPDSEYWIVSSGPEEAAWKKLTEDLGIAHCVTFWGHLPKITQVFEKLSQADVLVHPALHEAFGNVCLEALAAGRPVICLNTGGPAVQVTPECGFRAPVESVEAAVQFMADAMLRLYEDPELRVQMGKAARQRARSDFNWSAKAERMNRVYHELCGVPMPDVVATFQNGEGQDHPQRAKGLEVVE